MNTINKGLVLLWMVGMAGCTQVNTQQPPAAPGQAVRIIEFAENSDGSGDTCKVDITSSKEVWLNKRDYQCKNDQMSYFKLDNARSAMTLELESKDCDDIGGWVFVLKTYIDPVTTPWISIPDLKGRSAGSVITRGVRKIEGRSENENIKGKLSCVRITVSE